MSHPSRSKRSEHQYISDYHKHHEALPIVDPIYRYMHSRPHERLLHKRRGIFDRVIQYLPVTHKPHVPRYES
jgi:hypothetical protein